jgi:hypothetical protein
LNMFPSMASAPSLAPAQSLKKLRQPIEKSYGIRAAPKRPREGSSLSFPGGLFLRPDRLLDRPVPIFAECKTDEPDSH